MMGGASSRRGLWLDPRTKILLLLFCILSAMMAPSLFYELGLVVLIGLLGVCFGKWKCAWKGVLFYALIVLLTLWIFSRAKFSESLAFPAEASPPWYGA